MKTSRELSELQVFREKCLPKTDREELNSLRNSIGRQSNPFSRGVAELVFEEKCLECINKMMEDLKRVGYKSVRISNTKFAPMIRAYPKIEPEWNPPLWGIVAKYFSCYTSRGSDAQSTFQVVEIGFPDSVYKEYNLEDE